MSVESRRFRFVGRVQGVGFRATAREIALALRLNGHVRNVEDGSVEAVASGTAEQLDRFVQRLQTSFGLKIQDVESWTISTDGPSADDPGTFEIRY
jgi:acylphosphatase